MNYNLNLENVSKLLNNKVILITGGTGSFGNKITETIFNNFFPKKLIIFSRDEFKQSEMAKKFPENKYPIRYFLGDIRDKDRLFFAFKNVDVIFHAAALKQVPALEYNPFEAVKTNIIGTQNIIEASIHCGVKKVICVSTDKCVNPVNLYGATKLCFEKLAIAGNAMGGGTTQFSVLRYGNVFGSRGSVVPLFLEQLKSGILTITDEKMTRFTMTLDSAINFVLNSASIMIGGEIFVPKLPSYNILQLAKIIGPECEIKISGIRPGEKINESMLSDSESHLAIETTDKYVILQSILVNKEKYEEIYGKNYCKENWLYSSGNNILINDDELKLLVEEYKKNYSK
jgi:UDP-N-acetylglucosamine 4,6-dehydratase